MLGELEQVVMLATLRLGDDGYGVTIQDAILKATGRDLTLGTIHKTLTRDDFHVSDYSPWEGWTVSGWPVTTLLRGRVIADRGRLLGQPGDGQLVPRRIDPVVLRRPAC